LSKTIRFALMLALTALASWVSTPRPAHALPTCSSIDGGACFTHSIRCNGSGAGFCVCENGSWSCF
jgi:hypothetical protein